ncbi:MAG TPA: FAD-dependent oxidoreductase, partial [Paracoccaceae bacterium]|nr:FAD-dependent oxidoreductase [Paracoccaceae bacterium]
GQAQAMRTGAGFGIAPVEPQVDFAKVMQHVRDTIAKIEPHDSVERFEGLGVNVVQAYGAFISPTELQAGDCVIEARRFVIATGSSPMVPPIPGLSDVPYLTNESVFDQTELPSHLIVIGGGPIGLEMAQAHCRLGAKVTVIEAAKALAKEDPELAAIALEAYRAEGLEILEGHGVEAVAQTADGVAVTLAGGRIITGSHILVAAGRRPNTESLGLEKAGVAAGRTGIAVDGALKTSNRRIYAIGDVTGGMQFTHVAGYQAGVVIRSALFGLPAKARTTHIPWATFTDPEIAHVGLSEAAAREKFGDSVEILRMPYENNDRAVATLQTHGLVKVMVYKGKPVGATIVGAQADELIQTWSLAISSRLKIGDVASMVSPYPTMGELNKRAAGQYYTPRLFENKKVKWVVKLVQKMLP